MKAKKQKLFHYSFHSPNPGNPDHNLLSYTWPHLSVQDFVVVGKRVKRGTRSEAKREKTGRVRLAESLPCQT